MSRSSVRNVLNFRLLICVLAITISIATVESKLPTCHIPQDKDRFDCHPAPGASMEECHLRGCCWNDPLAEDNTPAPPCYFPKNYTEAYAMTENVKTAYGRRLTLKLMSTTLFVPHAMETLHVEIIYPTLDTLRVRVVEPTNSRFEVPFIATDVHPAESKNTNFIVECKDKPFSLKVTHKSTGNVLLDTSVAPLLYGDQYIQFSTSLPSMFIYGLGEHRNPMRMTTSWQKLAFWNRDQAPVIGMNLYGSDAFAMFLDKKGNAMGHFFLNSNAMEAVLQPAPAITYRTIGGIIDLFLYGGPSPEDVVRQHWEVVRPPYFQPMWAMGFHLSRYGYKDINDLKTVINRMKSANFPYDTQWTDIDSMRNYLVFTYDEEKWAGLPDLVRELHQQDMYYTPINDPCIGSKEPVGTYRALDEGNRRNIFITHENGEKLTGKVWPGECYFPDFTHPEAHDWWKDLIAEFNATVPFDGLWIDMNEPANFVDGDTDGCSKSSLNHPWYVPSLYSGSLYNKTVCPSARQHMGSQYNLHNLYGLIEAKVSMEVLKALSPDRRHFILTRSHFSGSGQWAAHWGGDNYATWQDMYYSITELINFNMFGISFFGPDICGFFDNTTEEMCMRWQQLGAFFPFMRNHNGIGYVDQDPASWSDPVRSVMKNALIMRYRMIPFWYTINYEASMNMHTVAQPLFYLYPKDETARWLDTQFFIGRAVMVVPVLNPGVKQLHVYLPPDEPMWYMFPELDQVNANTDGYMSMAVDSTTIGLFIRSGVIVPMMTVDPNKNLMQNRKLATFELIITLMPETQYAEGSLYWDDGISMNGPRTIIDMYAGDGGILLSKTQSSYVGTMTLTSVNIGGLKTGTVDSVTIDDQPVKTYTQTGHKLNIYGISVDLNTANDMNIRWRFSTTTRVNTEL